MRWLKPWLQTVPRNWDLDARSWARQFQDALLQEGGPNWEVGITGTIYQNLVTAYQQSDSHGMVPLIDALKDCPIPEAARLGRSKNPGLDNPPHPRALQLLPGEGRSGTPHATDPGSRTCH